jgi:hypothetical protein
MIILDLVTSLSDHFKESPMPFFRRRPIPPRRRPFPLRGRPPRPLSPAARRAFEDLQRAHALIAQGKPGEAAAIFEVLADKAAERNLPRAPQLCIQAGRAWIEAGEVERGFQRLREGIRLLERLGQLRRLPVTGQRILTELRARNLTEQADALEAEIQALLAEKGIPMTASAGLASKPRLPAKCSYCGGNVLPDEVEWIDEHCATCDYCGSLLEAKV